MELQDLLGLAFLKWCVQGDFNVIKRISEKLGGSRLTPSMKDFDEFIRKSELIDLFFFFFFFYRKQKFINDNKSLRKG